MDQNYIIRPEDGVLVTGAGGFIGCYVINELLKRGFSSIRCLIRETSDTSRLINTIDKHNARGRVEIISGNLLSREDCLKITKDMKVIYHLAAAMGTKSFSEAFLNSVVTTRNLIEPVLKNGCLRRFVNVSSFIVYKSPSGKRGKVIDESSPIERQPETRAQAYCYGKVKQDELVSFYGEKYHLPYVIVRPGTVYGPGKAFIPPRIGNDTFGIFLHLGGPNRIPLSYVSNCAEAIVLAGLAPGIEKEVFNVVDDDLPTSRRYLREYKKKVKDFKSIYLPHFISYLLYFGWEKMAKWSKDQIPPVYTRKEWKGIWKKAEFTNDKIKQRLGWQQTISTEEGLKIFFEYCREFYRIKKA